MPAGNPEISICIPAYARTEYLREAIASVLAQTFTDLEVVVSDDAGDARELAASFADERVRYESNERTLGMAANWQAAIARSRGRFVGLLMDDDRLLPSYLETLRPLFDRHPDVGVAFANHYFERDGEISARAELIAPGLHRDILPTLVRFNPVPICSTLMRREVMLSLLPLPDNHAADFLMMMRAALAGVVFYYVAEPLMIYRVHERQLSSRLDFAGHRTRMWEELGIPAGSELDRLRRSLPMWQ